METFPRALFSTRVGDQSWWLMKSSLCHLMSQGIMKGCVFPCIMQQERFPTVGTHVLLLLLLLLHKQSEAGVNQMGILLRHLHKCC